MSDLVGNPEDRFSHVAAQIKNDYNHKIIVWFDQLIMMSQYLDFSSSYIAMVRRPVYRGLLSLSGGGERFWGGAIMSVMSSLVF